MYSNKSKGRLLVPLIILVGLIVAAIIWFGLRMHAYEKNYLENQKKSLLEEKLLSAQADLNNKINKLENMLFSLLQTENTGPEYLREFTLNQPLITQAFTASSLGQLTYPKPNAPDLSEREKRFIERTREIIDSKILTSSFETLESGQKLEVAMQWYSYYWNDGLHILAFRKLNNKDLFGLELNTARFFAEIINLLPTQNLQESDNNNQLLSLNNQEGKIIYMWGNTNILNKDHISQSIPAPSPLKSWSLVIHASDSSPILFAGSITFNILSAVALFTLTIIILVFFIYKQHRYELDQAALRVNFASQVSHELKTPLTNIRMYSDLLESRLEENDLESKKFISVITSESQRLSRLISNILTFSSKDKNHLKLNTQSTDVSKLINDILSEFKPTLLKSSIDIETILEKECVLNLDPDIIKQIISNLISNVEKYAASGGKIIISTRSEDDYLVINFRDFGPGIPKNERNKIFKPFYRISNKLTDGVSGTGIGLTISRDLARLHGGDIALKECSQGTEFEIKIHTIKESHKI
jgi:signal transduction histidine kinase